MASPNFDLNKLMEDPMFAGSIGLLGGASTSTRPLLTAYQLMTEQRAAKQQQQQQERSFGLQQQQLGMQGERIGMERERLGMDRDEQEFMRPLKQAQVKTAELNAATLAATLEQRKKEEAAKAARIQWFQESLPYFMRGQVPPGGMMPPQPGAQPGMQPQSDRAEPMPDEPVGKFGTPVRYLNALEQVESSGNPLAVGPIIGTKNGKPVRAKGAFQFLDDTVDMLSQSGFGKFDPFNREQSRDAADFYLQKLVKQHGSYEKALAAYGGFKSKDPTPYVRKVMGGPPERQAREQAQNRSNLDMQQGNQYAPVMSPGIKIDLEEGSVDLNLTPSYEPHKLRQAEEELDIKRSGELRQRYQTSREYGPGGFKEREAERADVRTGVDVSAEQRAAEKARMEKDAAERERRQVKAKETSAVQSKLQDIEFTQKTIDELLNDKHLPFVTGRGGLMPKGMAQAINPEWGNTIAKMEQVSSKQIIDMLQTMRQNAPTGASGFGQFQQFEKEMFLAAQGLDRAKTAKEYRTALERVQKVLDGYKQSARNIFSQTYGELAPPAFETTPKSASEGVISFDEWRARQKKGKK